VQGTDGSAFRQFSLPHGSFYFRLQNIHFCRTKEKTSEKLLQKDSVTSCNGFRDFSSMNIFKLNRGIPFNGLLSLIMLLISLTMMLISLTMTVISLTMWLISLTLRLISLTLTALFVSMTAHFAPMGPAHFAHHVGSCTHHEGSSQYA
jgi:hypothetical protein